MDQEPLVREQIDAARKFIGELAKLIPVRAAFWLKPDEDSHWDLYIATDGIKDVHAAEAYDVVGKASDAVDDPNFNPLRVTLIGIKDPRARAALEMYERYHTRIPIFRWGENFGGVSIQGLYLYPPPVAAVSE
jgi:hypothetical protein